MGKGSSSRKTKSTRHKSAARAYETRVVPIDSVRPHPRNEKYHSHPDSQIATLAESVETFDQYRPVVVWRNLIVAGQGVWHGMKRAGETEIEIKDVSRLPERTALSLMLTDNSLAQYSVTNEEEFAALVKELAKDDEVLARLAVGEQAALERLLKTREKMPHLLAHGFRLWSKCKHPIRALAKFRWWVVSSWCQMDCKRLS
jgi:hypothetical protein